MDKLLDKIKNDLKLIEKWKATQRANLVYDRSSRYFVELSSENYNDFISTIKEIASYIKDTDGFTANNLLQIADYVCSKLINQGQWSGIYAVNDYFLGALQFTVDYLDSEGYKSLYKNKSSKLFISHSEKDKLYIEKFVEMLKQTWNT